MDKTPVSSDNAACGNGKKKFVIREREYALFSWQGTKTVVAVILATTTLIGTVLFSYFTAEASQNDMILTQCHKLDAQIKQQDEKDEDIREIFQHLHVTLKEQREVLNSNAKAIVRIDTRQEVLIQRVEKLDEKIDKLDK